VVQLPLSQVQFTQGEQQKFTKAMADTADVLQSKVEIVEIASARRNEINSTIVTSQVNVDSEISADQVQSRMTTVDLNVNLERQGLPQGTIASVAVTGKAQSTVSIPTSTIIGISFGSFTFIICTLLAGLIVWKKIQRDRVFQEEKEKVEFKKAIFSKLQNAQPNDTISFETLPLEKMYIPDPDRPVLSASPNRCVVKAKTIPDNQIVAIKIMVADSKFGFDEKQKQQHKIESLILDMMSDSKYACKKIASGKSEASQDMAKWLFSPNLCWFSMEYLEGKNMQEVLNMKQYLDHVECLQMARCVLAALKVMHSSHYIHGGVMPSNIHREDLKDGKFRYRLVGFGSAHQIKSDEIEPDKSFSSDLLGLGKAMQQLTANELASIMKGNRSERFMSADEMHQAVFSNLVALGEEKYSVYLSFRSISEGPVAKILFDELNHSITNNGHRVTVFWDARRMLHSDDWIDGLELGLLNSLCFFPLSAHLLCGDDSLFRQHLLKGDSDSENILLNSENILLSETLIAKALLEGGGVKSDVQRGAGEKGVLRCIYPILVEQPSEGHPLPSNSQIYSAPPPTHRYVIKFLEENASFLTSFVNDPENLSIFSAAKVVREQNKWEMWKSTTDEGGECELTAEQTKFAESWKPEDTAAFTNDADAKVTLQHNIELNLI
jgi:hypothetical protein